MRKPSAMLEGEEQDPAEDIDKDRIRLPEAR